MNRHFCRLLPLALVLFGFQSVDQQVVVTGDRVTLRSAPAISPETVLLVARSGLRLPLISEEGDWYQVRLEDGRPAWINRQFVVVEPAGSSSADIQTNKSQPTEPGADEPAPEPTVEPAEPDASAADPLSGAVSATDPTEGEPERLDASDEAGQAVTALVEPAPADRETGDRTSADVPSAARVVDAAAAAQPPGPPPGLVAAGIAALVGSFLAAWLVLRRRRVRKLLGGAGSLPLSREDLGQVLAKLDDRRKREDDAISAQFGRVRDLAAGAGQELSQLPARIEELKSALVNQQQRLDAYSDLLAAQNRKLDVLDEENRVLRALLTGPRT